MSASSTAGFTRRATRQRKRGGPNPPLVSNAQADRAHGNVVSSLTVQGHAWNGNRPLPALTCRIGTVQAVPHRSANHSFNDRELIDYLATIIRAHPETRVWNISANQEGSGLDPDEVSALGHEINELARAFNILPVIRSETRSQRAGLGLHRPQIARRRLPSVAVWPMPTGTPAMVAPSVSAARGRTAC